MEKDDFEGQELTEISTFGLSSTKQPRWPRTSMQAISSGKNLAQESPKKDAQSPSKSSGSNSTILYYQRADFGKQFEDLENEVTMLENKLKEQFSISEVSEVKSPREMIDRTTTPVEKIPQEQKSTNVLDSSKKVCRCSIFF